MDPRTSSKGINNKAFGRTPVNRNTLDKIIERALFVAGIPIEKPEHIEKVISIGIERLDKLSKKINYSLDGSKLYIDSIEFFEEERNKLPESVKNHYPWIPIVPSIMLRDVRSKNKDLLRGIKIHVGIIPKTEYGKEIVTQVYKNILDIVIFLNALGYPIAAKFASFDNPISYTNKDEDKGKEITIYIQEIVPKYLAAFIMYRLEKILEHLKNDSNVEIVRPSPKYHVLPFNGNVGFRLSYNFSPSNQQEMEIYFWERRSHPKDVAHKLYGSDKIISEITSMCHSIKYVYEHSIKREELERMIRSGTNPKGYIVAVPTEVLIEEGGKKRKEIVYLPFKIEEANSSGEIKVTLHPLAEHMYNLSIETINKFRNAVTIHINNVSKNPIYNLLVR